MSFVPKPTIVPKGGSRPRPIAGYGSVSEAARALGTTRQHAKQILRARARAARASARLSRELSMWRGVE